MLRALVVVVMLSLLPARAFAAESAQKTPRTSIPRALLHGAIPTVAGGAVLLGLVGAGAIVGSLVMAGYVVTGPSTLRDPYNLRAVPLYAGAGLVLGALFSVPLALLVDVLTSFTGWMVLTMADRPAPVDSRSAHLWAGLLPVLATVGAFAVAGVVASLVLVNRVRQGGLERDAFGALMGTVGLLGLMLLPAVPLIALTDVAGRGLLFWWLDQRSA